MATVPMYFLGEIELYKTVKPYRLDFEPDDDDVPRTNIERFKVPGIPVHDIRVSGNDLDFSKCGFTVLNMPPELQSLNYDDEDVVHQKYYAFLEQSVKEFCERSGQMAEVVAIDHKVRKRHSIFPISTGENYDDPQPVLVAHVDWTPQTIDKKLHLKLGKERAEEILTSHHILYLHAWRPLFGPLRDFPLALCDASTIDPEHDYEPCDDVYENFGVDENYLVYHRPGYKWFYLRDQEATEILLFRQFDSRLGIRSGIAHCAIENPIPAQKAVPRQSIEVELVVYWNDKETGKAETAGNA